MRNKLLLKKIKDIRNSKAELDGPDGKLTGAYRLGWSYALQMIEQELTHFDMKTKWGRFRSFIAVNITRSYFKKND